jgi:UbiA prenyltransferase family protein
MRASVALRLGRVSNLPTVWSNALAGAALTSGIPDPKIVLGMMVGFSAFYTGGMFLNDAFDASFDQIHRPERPIPSGETKASVVFGCGFLLLAAGFSITAATSLFGLGGSGPVVASGFVVAVIVLYDVWHKDNPLGPLIMGLCRALLYLTAGLAVGAPVRLTLAVAATALGYLIGLTYIAKHEYRSGLTNLWPLAFLCAPLAFAAVHNGDGLLQAGLCAGFIAWVACALSFLRPPAPSIGTAVGMLIGGISLVDAIFIASRAHAPLSVVAVGCFVATLLLQRRVAGT